MSHDWFCKCGHDVYSHGVGKKSFCQFCNCKRYEQRPIPEPSEDNEGEHFIGTEEIRKCLKK